MDEFSPNPVVIARESYEAVMEILPGPVRSLIEMVVFGGELPRADVSRMRWMAAQLRDRAAAMNSTAEEAGSLLAQQDSVGALGERVREMLGLHEKGAVRLRDEALILADQADGSANEAEKTLCVMFAFAIQLGWQIYRALAAAAVAGPAGQVAAAPAVEAMVVEGRAEVEVMRAGLRQAFVEGAARTVTRLTGLGPLQLAVVVAKSAAIPVAVDGGVQVLQWAEGNRDLSLIGENGENPRGFDLTSIVAGGVAGAGGAVGGAIAGRFAPKIFPRVGTSRALMGLVHGTAGAVSGLGAATLVTGWPQQFDQVLAELLNGGFGGIASAFHNAPGRSDARPRELVDGSGEFTDPVLSGRIHSETAAAPAESIRGAEPAIAAERVTGEVEGNLLPDGGSREQHRQGWEAAKAAWAAGSAAPRAQVADVAGIRGNADLVRHPEAQRGVWADNVQAFLAADRGVSAEARPAGDPAPLSVEGTGGVPPGAAVGRDGAVMPTQVPDFLPRVERYDGVTGGDDTDHRSLVTAGESRVGDDRGAAGSTALEAGEGGRSLSEHAADTSGEMTTGEPRSEGHDERSAADEAASPPVDGETDSDEVGISETAVAEYRERAEAVLADFHARSGEHVPEHLRLSVVPEEVLRHGLLYGDERDSLVATMEIVRRQTATAELPGGKVLRWNQIAGVLALGERAVQMLPGQGKTLMFLTYATQQALRHGSCLVVTTADGLAHREYSEYRRVLDGFGIDVFRADQDTGFGRVVAGRPAIVVATRETTGHLINAGELPPRRVACDEFDAVIDRGEQTFIRSEGAQRDAPQQVADEVFAAHDVLAGHLTHEDFGLSRIAEKVDVTRPDGTVEVVTEYWYEGRPQLTPDGVAKLEALPDGQRWTEGLGLSRLEAAAAAEFTTRRGVHYVMSEGRIVIIEQGEHGLLRNPVTSSESRWSAEPGKAGLAQAVEAKEIRAAEHAGRSLDEHQIVVRDDPDTAKSITAREIYGTNTFFDHVTGASGTLEDLGGVMEAVYGLQEPLALPRYERVQQFMEGLPDVVADNRAKLKTIATNAAKMYGTGEGRAQLISCHRNDLVAKQVDALVRAGVPRDAIEAVDAERIAAWGAEWEAELQQRIDGAGQRGKILVGNRQLQRGIDIPVSDEVTALGGLHVWMTEVPEQSYVYEQAKNRTARNGQRGSAQVLMSPQDALIRGATHLDGVHTAVVRYEQATTAHETAPTPATHEALLAATHDIRTLVGPLQQYAHARATAQFIQTYQPATDTNTSETETDDNQQETKQHRDDAAWSRDDTSTDPPDTDPDNTRAHRQEPSQHLDDGFRPIGTHAEQPDTVRNGILRLAGWLGTPLPLQTGIDDESDDEDWLTRLLDRAGLAPAAIESLNQRLGHAAPTAVVHDAKLSDEQALDQLTDRRNRLAAALKLTDAQVAGSEGIRLVGAELGKARIELAEALARAAASEAPAHHDVSTATARKVVSDAIAHVVTSTDNEPPAGHLVAAASKYLAVRDLLDLVVAVHQRNPNGCLNNAVTMMRVLFEHAEDLYWMPIHTPLAGHTEKDVEKASGGGTFRAFESLDDVAVSLAARPGGTSWVVYDWLDPHVTTADRKQVATRLARHLKEGRVDPTEYSQRISLVRTATKHADLRRVLSDLPKLPNQRTDRGYDGGIRSHLVLVHNRSDQPDNADLVVLDINAGTKRSAITPEDLSSPSMLLQKATSFEQWKNEQQKYIERLDEKDRRFLAIEFNSEGRALRSGSATKRPAVTAPLNTSVIPFTTRRNHAASQPQPDLDLASTGHRPPDDSPSPHREEPLDLGTARPNRAHLPEDGADVAADHSEIEHDPSTAAPSVDDFMGLLTRHGVVVGHAAVAWASGPGMANDQGVVELSVPASVYEQLEAAGWTILPAGGQQRRRQTWDEDGPGARPSSPVLALGRFRVSVGWPGVGTDVISHEDLAGRSWRPPEVGWPVAGPVDAYISTQETRDYGSVDRIKNFMLSPARDPLPGDWTAREIEEVTEILRSRLPQEETARAEGDPEIRRSIRLAAEGLFINRALYGHPDIGRANHLYDDAFERREFEVAAFYHNGMAAADDLASIMDNGVLLGADLGEILLAMVADAWSDLVYGGGRRNDRPEAYDELRSAELLHARAQLHGCDPRTARILAFAVNGTGFDERSGTQMISFPAAVGEMRRRWGPMHDEDFAKAQRIGRWVAAADLQTLSEPDAVVRSIDLWCENEFSERAGTGRTYGRVASEWGFRVNYIDQAIRRADRFGRIPLEGGHVIVRQALINHLRRNADFVHPDTGYQYPDGWLLGDRESRIRSAAKQREIAQRLATNPTYTILDTYRDAIVHAAQMREKYEHFRNGLRGPDRPNGRIGSRPPEAVSGPGDFRDSAAFEIRLLTPDDWESLQKVTVQTLEEAPESDKVTAEQAAARAERQWRDKIAADPCTHLVFHDSKPVGKIRAAPVAGRPDAMRITSVAVVQAARGTGVSHLLMQTQLRWLQANGYREAVLWHLEGNRAMGRLAERHGFTYTGRRMTDAGYPEPIVEMSRTLEQPIEDSVAYETTTEDAPPGDIGARPGDSGGRDQNAELTDLRADFGRHPRQSSPEPNYLVRPRNPATGLPDHVESTHADRGRAEEAVTELLHRLGLPEGLDSLLRSLETGAAADLHHPVLVVAEWWDSLGVDDQRALIVDRPDLVGRLPVPAPRADEANRLLIRRDLDVYIRQLEKYGTARPGSLRQVIEGAELSEAQRRHLRNLVDTQQALQYADALAAAVHPGVETPPVHVIAYDAMAFDGTGLAKIAIGDVDTATHVPWLDFGDDSSISTLRETLKLVRNVYERAMLSGPEAAVACVLCVGHTPPVSDRTPVERAVSGGDRLARDVVTFHHRRARARRSNPVSYLVGHRYGGTTVSEAAAQGRLAEVLGAIVLLGTYDPGSVEHASEYNLPLDRVFVGASSRDRRAYGGKMGEIVGRGSERISCLSGDFGAVRIAAEIPVESAAATPKSVVSRTALKALGYPDARFAAANPIDTQYFWVIDEYSREPTEPLANIAAIVSGHGDTIRTAPHREVINGRNPLALKALRDSDPEAQRRLRLYDADTEVPMVLQRTASTAAHARSALARRGSGTRPQDLLPRPEDDDDTIRVLTATNALWWDMLRDNATHEDELSVAQVSVIIEHSHEVGNGPGFPDRAVDLANRLQMDRELDGLRASRPAASVIGALGLRDKNDKLRLRQLRNILSIKEALAAATGVRPGVDAPPVHVLKYDSLAYGGDGRVVFAIGSTSRAKNVAMIIPGITTAAEKSPRRLRMAGDLWESMVDADPENESAAIAWIGYDAPSGNRIWLEAGSLKLAEEGGELLAREVIAVYESRLIQARKDPDNPPPEIHLFGHSYGSVAMSCGAASARLNGVVKTLTFAGSPGAGPVVHVSEYGDDVDVFAVAHASDPVPAVGALGLLGINPASEEFGAQLIESQLPDIGMFGRRFPAHGAYFDHIDPDIGWMLDSLRHFGMIGAGRGHRVPIAPQRPVLSAPTALHRIFRRSPKAPSEQIADRLEEDGPAGLIGHRPPEEGDRDGYENSDPGTDVGESVDKEATYLRTTERIQAVDDAIQAVQGRIRRLLDEQTFLARMVDADENSLLLGSADFAQWEHEMDVLAERLAGFGFEQPEWGAVWPVIDYLQQGLRSLGSTGWHRLSEAARAGKLAGLGTLIKRAAGRSPGLREKATDSSGSAMTRKELCRNTARELEIDNILGLPNVDMERIGRTHPGMDFLAEWRFVCEVAKGYANDGELLETVNTYLDVSRVVEISIAIVREQAEVHRLVAAKAELELAVLHHRSITLSDEMMHLIDDLTRPLPLPSADDRLHSATTPEIGLYTTRRLNRELLNAKLSAPFAGDEDMRWRSIRATLRRTAQDMREGIHEVVAARIAQEFETSAERPSEAQIARRVDEVFANPPSSESDSLADAIRDLEQFDALGRCLDSHQNTVREIARAEMTRTRAVREQKRSLLTLYGAELRIDLDVATPEELAARVDAVRAVPGLSVTAVEEVVSTLADYVRVATELTDVEPSAAPGTRDDAEKRPGGTDVETLSTEDLLHALDELTRGRNLRDRWAERCGSTAAGLDTDISRLRAEFLLMKSQIEGVLDHISWTRKGALTPALVEQAESVWRQHDDGTDSWHRMRELASEHISSERFRELYFLLHYTDECDRLEELIDLRIAQEQRLHDNTSSESGIGAWRSPRPGREWVAVGEPREFGTARPKQAESIVAAADDRRRIQFAISDRVRLLRVPGLDGLRPAALKEAVRYVVEEEGEGDAEVANLGDEILKCLTLLAFAQADEHAQRIAAARAVARDVLQREVVDERGGRTLAPGVAVVEADGDPPRVFVAGPVSGLDRILEGVDAGKRADLARRAAEIRYQHVVVDESGRAFVRDVRPIVGPVTESGALEPVVQAVAETSPEQAPAEVQLDGQGEDAAFNAIERKLERWRAAGLAGERVSDRVAFLPEGTVGGGILFVAAPEGEHRRALRGLAATDSRFAGAEWRPEFDRQYVQVAPGPDGPIEKRIEASTAEGPFRAATMNEIQRFLLAEYGRFRLLGMVDEGPGEWLARLGDHLFYSKKDVRSATRHGRPSVEEGVLKDDGTVEAFGYTVAKARSAADLDLLPDPMAVLIRILTRQIPLPAPESQVPDRGQRIGRSLTLHGEIRLGGLRPVIEIEHNGREWRVAPPSGRVDSGDVLNQWFQGTSDADPDKLLQRVTAAASTGKLPILQRLWTTKTAEEESFVETGASATVGVWQLPTTAGGQPLIVDITRDKHGWCARPAADTDIGDWLNERIFNEGGSRAGITGKKVNPHYIRDTDVTRLVEKVTAKLRDTNPDLEPIHPGTVDITLSGDEISRYRDLIRDADEAAERLRAWTEECNSLALRLQVQIPEPGATGDPASAAWERVAFDREELADNLGVDVTELETVPLPGGALAERWAEIVARESEIRRFTELTGKRESIATELSRARRERDGFLPHKFLAAVFAGRSTGYLVDDQVGYVHDPAGGLLMVAAPPGRLSTSLTWLAADAPAFADVPSRDDLTKQYLEVTLRPDGRLKIEEISPDEIDRPFRRHENSMPGATPPPSTSVDSVRPRPSTPWSRPRTPWSRSTASTTGNLPVERMPGDADSRQSSSGHRPPDGSGDIGRPGRVTPDVPSFEDVLRAGRESGVAVTTAFDEAPGVIVRVVTFNNGVRVFAEIYADPVVAVEQVLRTNVGVVMKAPIRRAWLFLDDFTVYREIVPSEFDLGVGVEGGGILSPDSVWRLNLFSAVTETKRTPREWGPAPDEGGHTSTVLSAPSAEMFVRRIGGRDVWQDHGKPRAEIEAIRERVAHLESWIHDLPIPIQQKRILGNAHHAYRARMMQIERRAVHTPREVLHRAGLDSEAQAKARSVERFLLEYPHFTIMGFDHPKVHLHVVDEIFDTLKEMLIRFAGRTNIRELHIDFGARPGSTADTFRLPDSETTYRTVLIRFSLRDVANPVWTVVLGKKALENGFNPIGDRPFRHDVVHEFIHAIDDVEGLSVTLQPMLDRTWSLLDMYGLINESKKAWLASLYAYAFMDETKTDLNDREALAVGFVQADIHGAAVGTAAWAIREYVLTGQPPQVTRDLPVELRAPSDPSQQEGMTGTSPDAAQGVADTVEEDDGPRGSIGARPGDLDGWDEVGESVERDEPDELSFAEVVYFGLQSGIAETAVVEETPGVKVEKVTCNNGMQMFRETYADPVVPLIQRLRSAVGVIMEAPIREAHVDSDDLTVYREIVPGRLGSSVWRMNLFAAVTGTDRTPRERGPGPGPDDEVISAVNMFVRRVDGRNVWQDHERPRQEIADIREQVAYFGLASMWDFDVSDDQLRIVLAEHSSYMSALAQIERHAVHTPGEILHRAGLDSEGQAKARLVERFLVKYPDIVITGVDRPEVPGLAVEKPVEEVLGALDEMLGIFRDRTNIRELSFDFLIDLDAYATTLDLMDLEWEFRTSRTRITFNLPVVANPDLAVESGIRDRNLGYSPVGDRLFRYVAIHEFIHALDYAEDLSDRLREVLHNTWSRLYQLGLINESEQAWLARLHTRAFNDPSNTRLDNLDDDEALAEGFAEAYVYGAAKGTPQWAIFEYALTGRPPQVTLDLDVAEYVGEGRPLPVSPQVGFRTRHHLSPVERRPMTPWSRSMGHEAEPGRHDEALYRTPRRDVSDSADTGLRRSSDAEASGIYESSDDPVFIAMRKRLFDGRARDARAAWGRELMELTELGYDVQADYQLERVLGLPPYRYHGLTGGWRSPSPFGTVFPVLTEWLPGVHEPQPSRLRYLAPVTKALNLTDNDVLYDIGSGLGLVCLWFGAVTAVGRAIGIEIWDEYAEFADNRASALGLSHVSFVNRDVLDVDISDGTVFYYYNPFRSTADRDSVSMLADRFAELGSRKEIRIAANGRMMQAYLRQSVCRSCGASIFSVDTVTSSPTVWQVFTSRPCDCSKAPLSITPSADRDEVAQSKGSDEETAFVADDHTGGWASPPRIVIVGPTAVECVIDADGFPDLGESRLARSVRVTLGETLEWAVRLARSGAAVSVTTVLGGDELGQSLESMLEREGIDTTGLRFDSQIQTPMSARFVRQDGAERRIGNGSVGLELTGSDIGNAISATGNADAVMVLDVAGYIAEAIEAVAAEKETMVVRTDAPDGIAALLASMPTQDSTAGADLDDAPTVGAMIPGLETRSRPRPRAVVVGAAVADFVIGFGALPDWGEVRDARSMELTKGGGKGMTLGVALARGLARVTMIAAAGRDLPGGEIRATLAREGVGWAGRIEDRSAVCTCLVREDGEPSFLWRIPRELELTEEDVLRNIELIRDSEFAVLTFESPDHVIAQIASAAREAGTQVVLQPAPAPERFSAELMQALRMATILVPNEREARAILEAAGIGAVPIPAASLPDRLYELLEVPTIAVTLGARGCAVRHRGRTQLFEAHPVDTVVDGTGASDAFTAWFVLGMVSGQPVESATQIALSAAAHAIARPGSYSSMPHAFELDRNKTTLAELYERHIDSAREVAARVIHDHATVDDVVADAFTEVLSRIRDGIPPRSFRRSLSAAIERAAEKYREEQARIALVDDIAVLDGAGLNQPTVAVTEAEGLIAAAYERLPQQWRELLWAAEVQGDAPVDLAPSFGMTRKEATALAHRAREGLRLEFLQLVYTKMPRSGPVAADCEPTSKNLGAYLTDGLPRIGMRMVRDHLASCDACRQDYSALASFDARLRRKDRRVRRRGGGEYNFAAVHDGLLRTMLPDDVVLVGADDRRITHSRELRSIAGKAVSPQSRNRAIEDACARVAVADLGLAGAPVIRGLQDELVWPSGVVGAVVNKDGYCAAAVGHSRFVRAIGVEMSAHERVSAETLHRITRSDERVWLESVSAGAGIHWDRVLLSAKTAACKALTPIVGHSLGHTDVLITIESSEFRYLWANGGAAGTFRAHVSADGVADDSLPTEFTGRYVVGGEGIVLATVVVYRSTPESAMESEFRLLVGQGSRATPSVVPRRNGKAQESTHTDPHRLGPSAAPAPADLLAVRGATTDNHAADRYLSSLVTPGRGLSLRPFPHLDDIVSKMDENLRAAISGWQKRYGPYYLENVASSASLRRDRIEYKGLVHDENDTYVGYVACCFEIDKDSPGRVIASNAVAWLEDYARGRGFLTALFSAFKNNIYHIKSSIDAEQSCTAARLGLEWDVSSHAFSGVLNSLKNIVIEPNPTVPDRERRLLSAVAVLLESPGRYPSPNQLVRMAGTDGSLGERIMERLEWPGVLVPGEEPNTMPEWPTDDELLAAASVMSADQRSDYQPATTAHWVLDIHQQRTGRTDVIIPAEDEAIAISDLVFCLGEQTDQILQNLPIAADSPLHTQIDAALQKLVSMVEDPNARNGVSIVVIIDVGGAVADVYRVEYQCDNRGNDDRIVRQNPRHNVTGSDDVLVAPAVPQGIWMLAFDPSGRPTVLPGAETVAEYPDLFVGHPLGQPHRPVPLDHTDEWK